MCAGGPPNPVTPIRVHSLATTLSGTGLSECGVVTKSLCPSGVSLCGLDVSGSIVVGVDILAIAMGVAMFAILLALVSGIDRI